MFQTYVQLFYLDVAKVDMNVAYIYASVSSVFICTLQLFSFGSYNVCNGYTRVFKFFLVFFKCFRHMLQVFQLFWTYVAMFHLNVAKVDQMLHMLNETHFAAAACCSYRGAAEWADGPHVR
jgi:hypothetical protein